MNVYPFSSLSRSIREAMKSNGHFTRNEVVGKVANQTGAPASTIAEVIDGTAIRPSNEVIKSFSDLLGMNLESMKLAADQDAAKLSESGTDVDSDVKFWPGYVPWGVTSFEELDAWNASREAHSQLSAMVDAMSQMAENIFNDDMITDKPAAIVALADDFSSRVDELSQDIKAAELPADYLHPKVKDATTKSLLDFKSATPETLAKSNSGDAILYRAKDGNTYFYGRPTNRWRDRDYWSNPDNGGEIITDAAHTEFDKFLNENPGEQPELWVMHEELAALESTGKAIWHDYADGFMHFIWQIDPSEAKYVQNFIDNYSTGMSHGFFALERDEKLGLITMYRMKEASLVPVELAANVWAGFDVIDQKANGMFSDDKRSILLNTFGESWVLDQEKSNATMQTALDAQGIDTKDLQMTKDELLQMIKDAGITAEDLAVESTQDENADGTTQDDAQAAESADTDADGAAGSDGKGVNESDIVGALTAMQEGQGKINEQLIKSVSLIEASLAELRSDMESSDQTKGRTLASFTASLNGGAGGKSIIGTEQAHVPAKSKLSKQNPQPETSHALASIFE